MYDCSNGECPFCKIVEGKSEAYVVYEDDSTIAFLDHMPYSKGHLLIIPKKHVTRLVELNDDERGAYMTAITRVLGYVEKYAQNYHLSANQGKLANQVVFHQHFHVIPRYEADNKFFSKGRRELTKEDAMDILQFF